MAGLTLATALAGAMASAPAANADTFTPVAKGNLVVSLANGQVNEYTPAGALVRTLIPSASTPTGTAFDAAGNLYVTEFSGNDILKMDALSGVVSVFASNATLGDGTVFNSPESLAFGPGYKRLYVSDANRGGPGGGIHVLDPATGHGAGFLPLASSSGSSGAGESDWLAFDGAGTLFMTNENPNQGVMKVDTTAGDIVQPSFIAPLPNDGYAISFDNVGNIWVSETNQIVEYNASGQLIRSITNPNFSTVFSAVFNPPFNSLYAGDLGNGNVYNYDLNGTLIGTFNAGSGIDGLSVAGTVITPPATASDQRVGSNGAEPSMAVNPKNANNIVVGFTHGATSGADCEYAVTQDAGAHWFRNVVQSPAGYPNVGGDASVAFSKNGDAYISCLSLADADLTSFFTGTVKNAVFVVRSTDEGRTFGAPSIAASNRASKTTGTFNDQEDLAVGPDGAPYVCFAAVAKGTTNPNKSEVVVAQASSPVMQSWVSKKISARDYATGCSVAVTPTGRAWVGYWDKTRNAVKATSKTAGQSNYPAAVAIGAKSQTTAVNEDTIGRKVWFRADPRTGTDGAVAFWATAGAGNVGHMRLAILNQSVPGPSREITGIVDPHLPTMSVGLDGSVVIGAYSGDYRYTVGQAFNASSDFVFHVVASAPSSPTSDSASVPSALRSGLLDYTSVIVADGHPYAAWTDDRSTQREIWVGHV